MVHLSIGGRAYWFIYQSAEEPIGSVINRRKSLLVHLPISGRASCSSISRQKSLLFHLPISERAYWFIYQSVEEPFGNQQKSPLVHLSIKTLLFHLLIGRRAHWFISQLAEEPIGSFLNQQKSLLVHLSIIQKSLLVHLSLGGRAC